MNSWVVYFAKYLLNSHKHSHRVQKTPVKYQHSPAAPQELPKWEPFILGEVPFLLSLSRSGSCYTWTHTKKKKKTEAVKGRHLPCIPLCLGNVTKYMGKRIGNDASELGNCSDPFHGEGFACSSLPICKNST